MAPTLRLPITRIRPSAYPKATVASVRVARPEARSVANALPLVNATKLQDAAGEDGCRGKGIFAYRAGISTIESDTQAHQVERVILTQKAPPVEEKLAGAGGNMARAPRKRASCMGFMGEAGSSEQARWLMTRTSLMPRSRVSASAARFQSHRRRVPDGSCRCRNGGPRRAPCLVRAPRRTRLQFRPAN